MRSLLTMTVDYGRMRVSARLLVCLPEIFQVGRALILLGRHQITIETDEVCLVADPDILVVSDAIGLDPDRLAQTVVVPGDRPWPGICVIDRRDPIVQKIAVRGIEKD